ncbi:MAG TPA: iron-containing alcohol dehydrogenase [Burkholderiales bacterium]|nr:iron-containing alcohol dehydrogenase [Burkholderiales bacterium]
MDNKPKHSGMFVLPATERIVYGRPAAEVVPQEAERLGAKRVFLMVSGTMNRTTDEVAKLRDALGNRYAATFDAMPSHTPRDAVLEAAKQARAAEADLLVTFGGGSLTDGGKMVRLALQHGITDMDGFDAYRARLDANGKRITPEVDEPRVEQIAVPTTLSAGEFHDRAGCSDPRHNAKHSYRHRKLLARVIVLDPAPTVHTPLWVWLSTGIRCLDHAVEGVCSPSSNPASDGNFLQAITLLAQGLPRVASDPADLDARLECQLAMWLAMSGRMAAVNMGASHALGHALGGTCGVAHGHTSCLMLPHVLRYNAAANPEKQARVAAAMGHPGEAAADVVSAFIGALGLPRRLAQVDVTREQFPKIAEHAMHDEWLHLNPRKIDRIEQVMEILESAA